MKPFVKKDYLFKIFNVKDLNATKLEKNAHLCSIETPDTHFTAFNKNTILISRIEHLEVIKILLENGAESNRRGWTVSNNHWKVMTPLELASQRQSETGSPVHGRVVKLLENCLKEETERRPQGYLVQCLRAALRFFTGCLGG